MQESNNGFLKMVLSDYDGVSVGNDWNPILSVTYDDHTHSIFCPPSSDYIVTVEVVDKAIDMKVDVIAYSEQWQSVTPSAREYSNGMGIAILEYKDVLSKIRGRGSLK